MSVHHLLEIWDKTKEAERGRASRLLTPDHLKQGNDYLAMVSDKKFETLVQQEISSREIEKLVGFSDVVSWLTSTTSNKPSSVQNIKDGSVLDATNFPIFMDRLRQIIWKAISDAVLNSHFDGLLPDSGCLLYFTSNLRHTYLIAYHLHYDRPVIEILDRIEQPSSLLDVRDINDLKSQRTRNQARNYLTSGHKIIIQGGVLTHVDRRLDRDVFGPTIDTLLLSDILCRDSRRKSVKSFLEIGSGNGHISAVVAAHFANVKEFLAIDLNEHSVGCTVRNVRSNLRYFHNSDIGRFEQFFAVFGKFGENVFRGKFDLVVSNPPYIPRPNMEIEDFSERYPDAVADTSLIGQITEHLPELLNIGGRLLIMTSSVTTDFVEFPIPDGFEVRSALTDDQDGFPVPFDVEHVLDQDGWVEELISAKALVQTESGYVHMLRPLWIERIG